MAPCVLYLGMRVQSSSRAFSGQPDSFIGFRPCPPPGASLRNKIVDVRSTTPLSFSFFKPSIVQFFGHLVSPNLSAPFEDVDREQGIIRKWNKRGAKLL